LAAQERQQVKYQSFWQLENGKEQIDFMQRLLSAENVVSPPEEVLDLLSRIVLP